jgi:hypothetical protein
MSAYKALFSSLPAFLRDNGKESDGAVAPWTLPVAAGIFGLQPRCERNLRGNEKKTAAWLVGVWTMGVLSARRPPSCLRCSGKCNEILVSGRLCVSRALALQGRRKTTPLPQAPALAPAVRRWRLSLSRRQRLYSPAIAWLNARWRSQPPATWHLADSAVGDGDGRDSTATREGGLAPFSLVRSSVGIR